jgi:hypothetical protein
MKTKIFTIIFSFILINLSFSQLLFLEQISGVTTPLNYIFPTGCSGSCVSFWICGDFGVVLKSTNYSGGTWINVSGNGLPSSINLNTIASVYGNSSIALTTGVRSDTAIVYRTTNAGVNWAEVFRQYNTSINVIILAFPSNGFMIGNPVGGRWSIWKTTNNGLTFDSTGMYLPQNGNEAGFRNSFNICNWGTSTLLFGTSNYRIYYTTNQGANWTFFSNPWAQNIYSMHFTMCGSPGNIAGYVGGTSYVYYTSNSGVIWTQSNAPPGTGNISGMFACPVPVQYFGQNEIMITRNDSNVYRIPYPGGNNWIIAYSAPAGKYRYLTNNMAGWSLFAVRDNGGISWGNCGTGGVTRISEIIPKEFDLLQNYPNPFNPRTKIEFNIPVKSLVRISIFDITGKEITRIFENDLPPGEYRAEWEASNYSSGVYFYSIIAVDQTNEGNVYSETKKMILLR